MNETTAARATPYHTWDCWYLHEPGGPFHVFMLGCQAQHKAAEKHDEHSELGYCTSTDLKEFSPPQWGILRGHGSNESIWTGCTVRDGAQYLMFYTVRQHAAGYWAQQVIRLAVSSDLKQWETVDAFELAPEHLDPEGRHFLREPAPKDRTIHAWRDPYVFRHAGRWHMLVSARSASQPARRNACVALLVADGDCREAGNWRLKEASLVTGYEELDVPQLFVEEGTGATVMLASLFLESDYDRSLELGYDPRQNTPGTKYRHNGCLVGFRALNLEQALAGRFIEPDRRRVEVDPLARLYAGQVVPELGGAVVGVDLDRGGQKLLPSVFPALRYVDPESRRK